MYRQVINLRESSSLDYRFGPDDRVCESFQKTYIRFPVRRVVSVCIREVVARIADTIHTYMDIKWTDAIAEKYELISDHGGMTFAIDSYTILPYCEVSL